jgi:hypothetical protein
MLLFIRIGRLSAIATFAVVTTSGSATALQDAIRRAFMANQRDEGRGNVGTSSADWVDGAKAVISSFLAAIGSSVDPYCFGLAQKAFLRV